MSTTTEAPPETPMESQQVRLFRYSTWLHIGPDAENCESVNEAEGKNECANPLHFHAWCRLPNQFQHRDLREKALAAKARRARQMRMDGTDAFEIMEAELDTLLRGGDGTKAVLIEELLQKDWWSDFLEAAANAREYEAEDGSKPFESVGQDQERFAELDAMAEDERPADEYAELQAHLQAYGDRQDEELKAMVTPKREALEARELSEIVDLIRNQRIDVESGQEFMHTYNVHEWLACTYKTPAGEPTFASMEAMQASAPEVIEGLKMTFADLEESERGGASGNS